MSTSGIAQPGRCGDVRRPRTAPALLKLRLSGGAVEVTDGNRPAYRGLAAAGLVVPLHTFARGRESAYRLTERGVSFFLPPPLHRPKDLSRAAADR